MSITLANLSNELRVNAYSLLDEVDVYGVLPRVSRAFAPMEWSEESRKKYGERLQNFKAQAGWGAAWIPFRTCFAEWAVCKDRFQLTYDLLGRTRGYLARQGENTNIVELCRPIIARRDMRQVRLEYDEREATPPNWSREELGQLLGGFVGNSCHRVTMLHIEIPNTVRNIRSFKDPHVKTMADGAVDVAQLVRHAFPNIQCLTLKKWLQPQIEALFAQSEGSKNPFSKLTQLKVSPCPRDCVDGKFDYILAHIKRLPALQSLHLSGIDPRFIAEIASPQLQHLRLLPGDQLHSHVESIVQLQSVTSLNLIALEGLSDEAMCQIGRLPQLRVLTWGNNGFLGDRAFYETYYGQDFVKAEDSFIASAVTPNLALSGFEQFVQGAGKLEELHFVYWRKRINSLLEICSGLPSLTKLRYNGGGIDPLNAQGLGALAKCSLLTEVSVIPEDDLGVGDNAIAALSQCKALTNLSLNGLGITTAGVKALVVELPRLRRLDLRQDKQRRLDAKAIEAVRGNLHVFHNPPR